MRTVHARPAADPSASTRSGPGGDGFRPDIEGMRGIAVLLVVLFHAGPFLVTGGFIGVDVFFVLSGFLITGLLLREAERSGRVDLPGFYARRFRRLIPAASIVLVVTLLAAPFAVAPLDLPTVAMDGGSAAVSLANVRFASGAGYFAPTTDPSPFLHFWSLSVEEQFYLLWPAVVALLVRVAWRRAALTLALLAITVASFAACVTVTASDPSQAFYLLPTRAWQLGLGGLLAVTLRGRADGGLVRGLGAWVGLAVVIGTAFVISEATPWPGAVAFVPTAGTALLIAGGRARGGPGRLLAVPPLRFTGRISYALYLWHWPLLVLPATAAGAPLPVEQRLLLVAVAFVLATLSTLLVEEPVRAGRFVLGGPPARAIRGGLLAILSVVAIAGGVGIASLLPGVVAPVVAGGPEEPSGPPLTADAGLVVAGPGSSPGDGADAPDGDVVLVLPDGTPTFDDSPVEAPSFDPGDLAPPPTPTFAPIATPTAPPPTPERTATIPPATPPPTLLPVTEPPGTDRPPASAGPVISADPTARPTRKPKPTPVSWALPGNVRPRLTSARDDEERLRVDGCLAFEATRTPPTCVYGDPKGDFVVALVGDSHSAHWFPAVERIADQRGWKLVTFTKVSCQFTLLPLYNIGQKRAYPECADFVSASIDRLRDLKPDLVIASILRFNYPARSSDSSPVVQGEAIGRALRKVPGTKVLIVDTQWNRVDVPSCLSRHRDDVRACQAARSDTTLGGVPERDEAAARVAGAALIDLTRVFCDGPVCPVVSDGIIRFRDDHHMTATYARSLAPVLAKALDRVLGPEPSIQP